MLKRHSTIFWAAAFVLAEFAWLGLLGIWIYWYVSNYLILEQVGDKLSPQITIDTPNVLVFVGGIILIVCIAFIMTLVFRNFTVQLRIARLYDNFIANVTHELKSPLSSIQLYLETLKTKNVPKEKQAEFIGMMIKDSERLKRLINSILEISQLETKRVSHDYQIYEADKIFNELIYNTADQYRINDSVLKVEGSVEGQCVIDKNAMQIVFDNLIDNALKFTVEKPELQVSLSRNKSKLLLSFRDNGIGVSLKDQKKIFQKFQRVYNKSIPNVKGTGLGLYWVREIIRHHGGKVSVSSAGKNKGSCFKIELPVYMSSKRCYVKKLLKQSARRKKEYGLENGN